MPFFNPTERALFSTGFLLILVPILLLLVAGLIAILVSTGVGGAVVGLFLVALVATGISRRSRRSR